jgi:hypothetical protein
VWSSSRTSPLADDRARFLPLLFVALTVANRLDPDERTRARRDSLGGSAFALLLDTFFVSITSLTGNARVFAAASMAMPLVGLYVTGQLLPMTARAGTMRMGAPHWKRNRVLPTASISAYLLQFSCAAALLANPSNSVLLRLEFTVILALYAGALVRTWEIITL